MGYGTGRVKKGHESWDLKADWYYKHMEWGWTWMPRDTVNDDGTPAPADRAGEE